MSLRLKALATLNVAAWLIAVPLLLASLLTPIVGFNGWQDHVLPGGGDDSVQLAGAPAREPASKAPAAPSMPDRADADAAPAAPAPAPAPTRVAAAKPRSSVRTVRRRAVARRRAAERRRLAARRRAAAREAERPVVVAAPPAAPEPVQVKATKPPRPPKPSKPPKPATQHAVPASVKVHKLKAPKVKAPKVKPPKPQPAAAPDKPGKGPK